MNSIANQEEFMDLQRKLMAHNKVKHQSEGRIHLNERAKRRDELTVSELTALPSSVKTFTSVGKMFMLAERSEIKSDLESRLGRINHELEGLYKQQEYTDSKIKETENAVKELMLMNAVKGGKK